MIAAEIHADVVLPLLFEPDRPRGDGRRAAGWHQRARIVGRIEVTECGRHHADDEIGARVQHVIARYVLGGISRREAATLLGVGDTQAQAVLSLRAWRAYGQPVYRALRRLGISPGRGQRSNEPRRLLEILRAAGALTAQAADRIERQSASRPNLVADLRLLAAGLEPL